MSFLVASVTLSSWVLVIGSLLLVHQAGFDSWKMAFPLTFVALALLGWIFAALLSSALALKSEDRSSLTFQVYVCSAVGSFGPLVYFLLEFGLYQGRWTGFLFDWLDHGWRWF